MSEHTALAVDRAAIDRTEIRRTPLHELAAGHVRLRVDHVAVTANTVTYAQFGDMLDYWGFYPVEAPWGAVPAIGWATVVESDVADVPEGMHVHGWFPMATTVDVAAVATRDGFRDDGAHRAAHAPIYRTFVDARRDPMYTEAADEERHSLVRPLFLTGFLIDAFHGDARFADVEQSIVLSASSKTAIGYVSAARSAGRAAALVGVTGERNVDFVRRLGLYDTVVTYGDVASLPVRSSVIVDMAGDGPTVAAVHDHLGDRIAHSMTVGKSHHDAAGAAVAAGPQPEFFFAPAVAQTMAAELGADEYQRRLAAGAAAFVTDTHRWLTVERADGPDAAQAAWARALSGSVPPDVGVVVSLHG